MRTKYHVGTRVQVRLDASALGGPVREVDDIASEFAGRLGRIVARNSHPELPEPHEDDIIVEFEDGDPEAALFLASELII